MHNIKPSYHIFVYVLKIITHVSFTGLRKLTIIVVFFPVPPFIETLDEVLVSEGETAVIECRSHGDPVPELTFQWADDHAVQRVN